MRSSNQQADHATAAFRFAQATDAAELERLARLDSARPLEGPVLVAEMAGKIKAAVSLDTGRHVADPFERTAELVAVLDVWRQRSRAGVEMPKPGRRQLALRKLMYRRPELAVD